MGLTKTDFMRGMQCPRMLWLDKNRPELKIIPPETQRRLDKGNEFGDKAMGLFGPFVEMTAYIPNTSIINKKKMVRDTRHHIEIGTENICEAAFDVNGNFCAVDILHKTDDGYEMYEVKNTHTVEQQHIDDASYQSYIVRNSGIDLKGVFLVYHGDDEEDPYEIMEITDQAEKYATIVEENIPRLENIRKFKTEPKIPMGGQCTAPYECWYCSHCEIES